MEAFDHVAHHVNDDDAPGLRGTVVPVWKVGNGMCGLSRHETGMPFSEAGGIYQTLLANINRELIICGSD